MTDSLKSWSWLIMCHDLQDLQDWFQEVNCVRKFSDFKWSEITSHTIFN